MWVASDARGLGLGRRLLAELERLAREAGVSVLRLETNRALAEAQALYRGDGIRRGGRLQRGAVRAPLVREAALAATRC